MFYSHCCVQGRLNGPSDLQICPCWDSNTGGSDLWSSTLPLDHGGTRQCMVFVLHNHWRWLSNGGQIMEALSWQEIRSLSKVGSRWSWWLFTVAGLDCINNYILCINLFRMLSLVSSLIIQILGVLIMAHVALLIYQTMMKVVKY